jgi:eukaryotic-like serine/threonine-protein kinase
MSDDSLLAQLAEAYTGELRAGKPTNIEEYARRYPELAGQIRELFPTLMMLEGMAATSEASTETPPSILAPDSIFGRYRIEREIGRGGMGVVYEATHVLLEKRIALKVLPVRTTADAGHLERFFREARIAAGLHHTNIVPVFDVGQVAGTPYYAMQYIEGRGLNEILQYLQSRKGEAAASGAAKDKEATTESIHDFSGRILSGIPGRSEEYFRWVAGIGIQAAEGLAYAHERKVIHRDIKPSNLLLDSEGVVWIADFGLARRIADQSMTHSGTLVGTPCYMSPEQAQAATRPVDHRSDIYSLGATLYELLTSRPVFKGKTPLDVISQILTREPVAPRRLNPEIPADLAIIVMKAMGKAPEDRYQSARELADDLHRWLKLEPIHARPIGPIGRTIRWCRRNPKVAAVTAISAALILVLSGLYYASLLRENANTRAALKREQEARSAADMNSYAANLSAAESYLRSNSIADAEQCLSTCSPSLRGWEWQHLNLRIHPELATIRLNSTPTQLTLSSDGFKVLWLSEEENNIHAADIQSQKLIPHAKASEKENTKTTGPPYLIAFGRDGERIARTLWKGGRGLISPNGTRETITVFNEADNLKKWNPLRNILEIAEDLQGAAISSTQFARAGVWEGESSVMASLFHPLWFGKEWVIRAVFSPEGTHFAAWTLDGKIRVCHTDSGKVLCTLPGDSNGVTAVTFSTDGESVAAGNYDGSVRVWGVPSGTPIAVLRGHTASISRLAFRPDGKQIVSGAYGDRVRLWDLSSGRLVHTFEFDALTLAFSEDGKRMVAAGVDGKVHIIETASGKDILSLSGHKDEVTSAIFDPNGARIISGSKDNTIRFWDAKSLTYMTTLEIPGGEVNSALWNPDGRHIAVSVSTLNPGRRWQQLDYMDRKVLIWDVLSGETVPLFRWPKERMGNNTFSPDSHRVAAVLDNEIQLLDLTPGSQPMSLTDQKRWITRAVFAPDGKTIATAEEKIVSGESDNIISIWEVSSGKSLKTIAGHGGRFSVLVFSPDSKRLISADQADILSVWDAATGRSLAILRGHKGDINYASFSPDGSMVLSSSFDNTVRVWDSSTGKEHLSFSCASADAIFDRDGNRIYAGCGDGTLSVWDTKTRKSLASLKSQSGPFCSLTLSPDGSRLIAGVGATIKIWDAPSLTPLLTLPAHDFEVESVTFSPDGSMVLSVGSDGKAKIWKSKRPD